MSPERWQKVKSVLDAALDYPTEDRAVFVNEICGGDDDLRQEVESLLAFEESENGALEQSAFSVAAKDLLDERLNDYAGQQIGQYKIVREIGRGGMGVVFLAEREDFERRVALKVIKRGMDSEAILRRFLNERQILASLEHPNIAQLYDGGTTADGLPFFVMEYVEGVPVNEYAAQKNLDLNERLKLFREICAAVSEAHRNLVIHRDLKPSNILVTSEGKPKLLDFGIAKLLKTENGNETATRSFVFTPEYASPEQVRGEKLTTATDVYSLGVILYELLAGARPYKTENQNISEIIKIVCDTNPKPPSAVLSAECGVRSAESKKINSHSTNGKSTKNIKQKTTPHSALRTPHLLKGDLDNVILKALRKEPERRYRSVEQFSEDIRRYLEHLPVTASRDTFTYRATKFINRNRYGVMAAALILLTLLGGLAATLYQANVARRERAKAEQRFADVRALANSFLFEFHDSIENLPGSTPSRELVVKRALEYLDKLSQEAGNDPQLQRELATAYEKIGKIQGNSYYSNLGDTDGSLKSYQRSLEIRETLAARDPNNRELQKELANSYSGVGDLLYTINDLNGGLQNYEKAAAIRENLAALEPNNLELKQSLAEIYTRLGDIKGLEGYPNLGDTLGSIENYQKAVALGEEITAAAPENLNFKASLATWQTNLGMLLATTGDAKFAIANGEKAVATLESAVAANPNNTRHKLLMLAAYNFLRTPLVDEMRFDEAIAQMRRVIKMLEEMSAGDPKNSFVPRSLGVSYNALGRTQLEAGDAKSAIENHLKALKISESLNAADSSSIEHRRDTALTLEFLANAQLKAGDYDSALANYRKAFKIYEENSFSDSSDDLAGLFAAIGKTLLSKGETKEAVETFRRAIPFALETAQKSPSNVKKQNRLAIYYMEGGRALKQLAQISKDEKDLRQGCEFLRKSYEIWDSMRQKGTLSKLYSNRPDEVSKEITTYCAAM